MYSENGRQILQASRNPLNGKYSVIAFVSSLLRIQSPSAVFFVIALFVINPFKSLSIGNLSHVVKEGHESPPSFANGYSPSSIVLPSTCAWIRASSNHAVPGLVYFRFLSASAIAMQQEPDSFGFQGQASTGTRVSARQVRIADSYLFSAFTATEASSFRLSSRASGGGCVSENFQSSKCLSDEVKSCRHNGIALCSAVGFGYRPNARRDCFLSENQGHVNAL